MPQKNTTVPVCTEGLGATVLGGQPKGLEAGKRGVVKGRVTQGYDIGGGRRTGFAAEGAVLVAGLARSTSAGRHAL